jgi:hypothetical protein
MLKFVIQPNPMKKILLFAFTLFICLNGYAQKGERVDLKKLKNDTIIWQKDSLLTREDFKGKVSKQWAGCAATFIMIKPVENEGNMLFSVQAVFQKSKSNIVQNSDYILKHEQLHFDICELYARKLRQMMLEKDFTKVKNIQNEIQNMYNKVNGEFDKYENKYDNDTNHGENPAKQKVWEDDVAGQLKDLAQYSSTDVNLVKN